MEYPTSSRKRTWKRAGLQESTVRGERDTKDMNDKMEVADDGHCVAEEASAEASLEPIQPVHPVQLYALQEEVEDHVLRHSILHIYSSIRKEPVRNTYNIIMADTSGSMSGAWPPLVKAWNQYVAPHLTEKTDLYIYDGALTFLREGGELRESDFTCGALDDLCLALAKIRDKVKECTTKWIRVFLISDGGHNATDEDPRDIIQTMATPSGKTCEVYILGIGYGFPAQYSVEIRSRLHSGSANMPVLFWAKDNEDIEEEVKDIETNLKESKVPVELNIPGSLLPGLEKTHDFYLGEWVYIDCDPDTLKLVQLSMEDKKLDVPLEVLPLTMDIFLDFLVPQWNSVLIQRHNLKKSRPSDMFPFMQRAFRFLYNQVVVPNTEPEITIHARLMRKGEKELKTRFQTLVNQSKTILTTEKFMDELELANAILLTTVTTRKHAVKGLKLKGHTEDNYAEDSKAFMDIYAKVKERLNDLQVTPEDCCRVTMTSTVSDLKDEGFPDLLKLNKFEFLKTFSMSGIPVFSHTRDSTELNPWSFKIDRILTSPFSVLSQVAMEEFASVDSGAVGQKNKDVRLQQSNEDSSYNAVVPVFSATVAKVVQPLVRTNLYAMCATFALLKNPHIVDYTVHIAGLAATWIKTLADHTVVSERPEFVKERLESVEATAMIYLDRPSLVFYLEELQTNPGRALMTECPQEDPEAKPLKCEALLKPLFLLHMKIRSGRPVDHQVKVNVVRLAAVEFLGRCLHYTAYESLPFINCFMKGLSEEEKRKEWLRERLQSFSENILGTEHNLLSKFYFPERIARYVMKLLKTKRETFLQVLGEEIKPKVTGLEKLRSVHNCGDVTWKRLQVCALELGLSESEVEDIFSEKNSFVYVCHALTHTSSSERMKVDIGDYNTCFEKVKAKLMEEVVKCAREILQEEVQSAFLKRWYEEYDACHGGTIVIRPMSRTELMEEARAKGIDVTSETFDRVYPRYNEKLGLLRNACQSSDCPLYLRPNRSFNQHVKCERRPGMFLHRLHYVASGEEDLVAKVDLIKSCDSNTDRVTPELLELYQEKLEKLSCLYQKGVRDRS